MTFTQGLGLLCIVGAVSLSVAYLCWQQWCIVRGDPTDITEQYRWRR